MICSPSRQKLFPCRMKANKTISFETLTRYLRRTNSVRKEHRELTIEPANHRMLKCRIMLACLIVLHNITQSEHTTTNRRLRLILMYKLSHRVQERICLSSDAWTVGISNTTLGSHCSWWFYMHTFHASSISRANLSPSPVDR